MDRETLRQELEDDNQQLCSSRIFRFLSAKQQKRALAVGMIWPINNVTVNDFLDLYGHQIDSLQGVKSDEPIQPTDEQLLALGVDRTGFNMVIEYLFGRAAG